MVHGISFRQFASLRVAKSEDVHLRRSTLRAFVVCVSLGSGPCSASLLQAWPSLMCGRAAFFHRPVPLRLCRCWWWAAGVYLVTSGTSRLSRIALVCATPEDVALLRWAARGGMAATCSCRFRFAPAVVFVISSRGGVRFRLVAASAFVLQQCPLASGSGFAFSSSRSGIHGVNR